MMNQHMSAGPGQHIPPAIPMHPHSRRQQEYHTYHHPAQPQSPMHHPYANYGHPAQYFSPHHGPPPQYPPPRWQHPYQPPPQPYMPPPPPQQAPYQPRSPMVVTSQPYAQPMTPVTRQTPVPPPPAQPQHVPSPRPIPQGVPAQSHTPVAPPSPAPAPQQVSIASDSGASTDSDATIKAASQPTTSMVPATSTARSTGSVSTTSPARRPSLPRAVDPLTLAPEHRMPNYPNLPWYSVPEAPFPPRASVRRRRQNMENFDSVALPARDTSEEASEVSTLAAPSEPETPATSQAPSENEFTQVSTPTTPAQASFTAAKGTAQPAQHTRRDTRTAIAVPNIPGFNKPRPSPPAGDRQGTSPSQSEDAVSASGAQKAEEGAPSGSSVETVVPVSSPPKAAPKSWADLVRRNAPASSSTGVANGGVITNGAPLPKSASLADALKQYSVQIDANLSFLEPRGLVNTGNMCYMNSILQVLVFCVPFYNFLDQVRQRTVHSMKSDTPLVDAMIMFMKEFRVLASAESADVLRMLLSQQQLEQYGEPVTPEYVYDAIRKLERFNSMRRGHQQDAEEFLGFLLEGLHDECVGVMRGQPMSDKPEENGVTSPDSVTSPTSGADGWLEVGPKQKASVTRTAGQQDAPSPITKIFGGHLRSELRVPGLKDSVTLEPYKPLQLDIGAQHVNNITDALKGLTRTEALTGDFGGRANSAKKQVFIDSLPPVLILHLKRFQYENNLTGTQKIWKKVGYPLELEIPKEVFQPSKRGGLAVKGGLPKYRLTSVVYHHGKSAAGGHYTVDVVREDAKEWIRMDDTVIRRIRPEDVAEGGAEEDPKLLAKALEQHKADQELQKQRNMYQGLDEADKEPEEEKPWSEVNGQVSGHRKWSSVANTNGTATPVSQSGKKTPTAKKESVRDNKVAYILFYERIRS